MGFKLETQRLFIRELTINDGQHFYDLNSNPNVLKYTGDKAFSSIEESREFLKNYNEYLLNGFGRWAVIEKQSGQFIGWCGLKKHQEGYIDLGYRFFENFWGKGYATESAFACIKYAKNKLKIKSLIGRVDPENKASIKVLEKLGFVYLKKGECNGINNALYYICHL